MRLQHRLCVPLKKRIAIFHLKIVIFTAVKNRSILYGHVFVIFTYYHFYSNIFCHVIWWYMDGAKYTIYDYLWYLLILFFTFMMILMRSGSFFPKNCVAGVLNKNNGVASL